MHNPAVRRVVALIGVVGFAAASAAFAMGADRPPMRESLIQTTGRIRSLDLSQITVGRTSCSLASSRTVEMAQGFAVGENVTIGCVANALRSISLQPVTAGPSHSDTLVFSVPSPERSSSTAPGSLGRGVVSFGWISHTTEQVSVTGTVNVTGPITALASTGVTVGDQTCGFLVSGNEPPPPIIDSLQVGEVVQMSCTTYSNGQSSGQITNRTASP
jgi:hypothetical protein